MGDTTNTKNTYTEQMNCPVENAPISAETKEGLAVRFTEHCILRHCGGLPEPAGSLVAEKFEELKARYH